MGRCRYCLSAGTAIFLLLLLGCGGGGSSSSSEPTQPGPPQVSLTRLSTDQFTNSDSQHATEVEPGMFASGSTIVTAFQVGRRYSGGASDIGFATSTDGGGSWSSGLLQGLTKYAGGTYDAASDPSVGYDRAHGVWLIASLVIGATDLVAVSRSSDAMTWSSPAIVSATKDADKQWITCDNTATSHFFGHCYVEWDDPSQPANGLIWMSTSSDGGITWSAAVNTSDSATGLGGQPLVQPNGTVVVPIENATGTQMLAFTSGDGGVTWGPAVVISDITDHVVAGNMRTSSLPSAAMDSSGRIYVVWQDCRFRSACSSNDVVISASGDGSTWTAPTGIPIDATSSTVDHFIPTIAVDPGTSGASAHLALTYYYYPATQCTATTCQLYVGFVSSQDGGNTWSSPTALAGPMSLSWLPNTVSGVMVGDYTAITFSNGHAYAVFAVARSNSGAVLDEAIYATTNALVAEAKRGLRPVMQSGSAVNHSSDHGPRRFYDLDHEHPIPPRKK